MELTAALTDGLSVAIADRPAGGDYPTARLQNGLLLLRDGVGLAEEGVGFGLPVLKKGPLTVFPGSVRLGARGHGKMQVIDATFTMDLVERLADARGTGPTSGAFYALRDVLAATHRRTPLLRGPLTAVSNAVRRRRGWQTTYAETDAVATIPVAYTIDGDKRRIRVAVDLTGLPAAGITEVVVMNELGARLFDLYLDSDGARLRGRRIGTWNEVAAARACFAGTASRVAFCVPRVAGAKLYRGRELVGSRLAWSGCGYSLRPQGQTFSYDIGVETAP